MSRPQFSSISVVILENARKICAELLSCTKNEIYFVPADAEAETIVPVPKNEDYSVSGNNCDGFIVTIIRKSDELKQQEAAEAAAAAAAAMAGPAVSQQAGAEVAGVGIVGIAATFYVTNQIEKAKQITDEDEEESNE